MADAKILSLLDTPMAPINDTVLGGVSSVIGTLNPHVSMVVVMNMSSMFTTFLLDRASFRNTTFQLGFLMSSKKNSWVS